MLFTSQSSVIIDWELDNFEHISTKMLRVTIMLTVLAVVARAAPWDGGMDPPIMYEFCNKHTSTAPPVTKPPIESYAKCETKNGTAGVCVPHYLCNSGNVIIDGACLIDIRVNHDECPSYLDSCCVVPDTRPPHDPITPPSDNKPQHHGCGWRNPNGVGFHITGDKDGESRFGEFPWVVAVFQIKPLNEDVPDCRMKSVYVGGGSLIHPSAILTVAHYVANGKTIRVRAGEWDTQTTKEIYPYQERDVASMAVHQDYNHGTMFYDIAILFLEKPMELAPNVGVVCLPPPGIRVHGGTHCLASGWGKDKFGQHGRYQNILKKVEVPVVERHQCQNALRKTRLGLLYELHTSFMCAGGEIGKDTCTGDGGSPLVCPIEFEKDRYMQSGIVTWGIGCGADGTPGVYVDVSHLRNWIDDKMRHQGLDTKVYTI